MNYQKTVHAANTDDVSMPQLKFGLVTTVSATFTLYAHISVWFRSPGYPTAPSGRGVLLGSLTFLFLLYWLCVYTVVIKVKFRQLNVVLLRHIYMSVLCLMSGSLTYGSSPSKHEFKLINVSHVMFPDWTKILLKMEQLCPAQHIFLNQQNYQKWTNICFSLKWHNHCSFVSQSLVRGKSLCTMDFMPSIQLLIMVKVELVGAEWLWLLVTAIFFPNPKILRPYSNLMSLTWFNQSALALCRALNSKRHAEHSVLHDLLAWIL